MNPQQSQPTTLPQPADRKGVTNPQRRRPQVSPMQSVHIPIKSDPAPTREEKQAEERQRFLGKVAPAVTDIRRVAHQIRRGLLHGFHQIGRILIRDEKAIRQGNQTWVIYRLEGTPLSAIAKEVGMDATTLSKCRKFAEAFAESEIDALVSQGLTWGHVRHLVTVPAGAFRQELLSRIASERLTIDELMDLIYQKFGNRRPGSGRKPQRPPTPTRALLGLNDRLRKFQSRTLDFLFENNDAEYDLPTELRNLPRDELTTEQRDQVVGATQGLRQIAAMAGEAAQSLQGTLTYFDRVLADRQQPSPGEGATEPEK